VSAVDPISALGPAVLDAHLAWADRFDAGAFRDPLLTAAPGERIAVRIEDALLADLAVAAVPKVSAVRARGMLIATDQRVVIIPPQLGARVEIRWDDPQVGQVVTELSGLGTIVATPERQALWGFVPPLLCDPTPDRHLALMGIAQWMRVTAAWYAAHDALEDWRALTRSWFAPERLEGL
jgi:hypothetical protein